MWKLQIFVLQKKMQEDASGFSCKKNQSCLSFQIVVSLLVITKYIYKLRNIVLKGWTNSNYVIQWIDVFFLSAPGCVLFKCTWMYSV